LKDLIQNSKLTRRITYRLSRNFAWKWFALCERSLPAGVVSIGRLRGFKNVRIAIATETRHTVANTAIQASASLLSFWDQRISASQAAAHLPERFRKMYNPDLAYQEQPQAPLPVLTAWVGKRQ